MRPRGEEGRAENTAGAWAAAAVVLALGALGFGVAGQFEVQDLEARVARLEQEAATPATVPVSSDDGLTDGGSTSTESSPPVDEAAVVAAYTALYDGSQPIAERVAFVDDPAGVLDAFEAAGGTFAQQAASLRARVDQVTFTSTATATVRYSLSAAGGSPLPRVGSARLVDGTWKVARSTVCADLEDAGSPCRG